MSTETTEEDQAEHERALVRADVERQYRLSGLLAKRALKVIASSPTSALFGLAMKTVLDHWIFLALGLMFSTIIFVAGGVYFTGNVLARRGFARQLRELDEGRQLPEARVVIR